MRGSAVQGDFYVLEVERRVSCDTSLKAFIKHRTANRAGQSASLSLIKAPPCEFISELTELPGYLLFKLQLKKFSCISLDRQGGGERKTTADVTSHNPSFKKGNSFHHLHSLLYGAVICLLSSNQLVLQQRDCISSSTSAFKSPCWHQSPNHDPTSSFCPQETLTAEKASTGLTTQKNNPF